MFLCMPFSKDANDYWSQEIESCGLANNLVGSTAIKDLWRQRNHLTTNGPAVDLANGPHCSQGHQNPHVINATTNETCVYEEVVLTAEVQRIIEELSLIHI